MGAEWARRPILIRQSVAITRTNPADDWRASVASGKKERPDALGPRGGKNMYVGKTPVPDATIFGDLIYGTWGGGVDKA